MTALEAVEAAVVPNELAAVAVKVYAVPLVNPVTVQEPKAPVPVQVAPPGLAVTVYEVPGSPPLPAVTVTVAWPSPATAVGAFGTAGGWVAAVGVAELDAADAPEVPAAFVAVDVKVYPVPLVRPVTVHAVAGTFTVHVAPPGLAVTV